MLLANSLHDRINRNILETGGTILPKAKYPYQPKEKNLKILFPSKSNSTFNLNILSKEEWKNTFTIKELKKKWDTKANLDFEVKHKKFSNEIITKDAVIAKKYVKDLIDSDIFENKQKRWNNSTSVYQDHRTEVKQKLFELNQGLKDFNIIQCKEQLCPEGVNSRNNRDILGSHWNLSAKLEDEEKCELSKDIKASAIKNSTYYWKINEDNRNNCSPFLVSKDRRKLEVIRHFKRYRTPFQQTMDLYNTMSKVTELTANERAKVEEKVKYNNPGALKHKEKLDGIVHKEMYTIYRDKYNELIGNLDKKELQRRQLERNKFKWNDKDLVNKILMIDSSIDKDKLGWFKPEYKNISQSLPNIKAKLLKPLVPKGNDIYLEQEKLKEIAQEEYKKQQKRELLLKQKFSCKSRSIQHETSKYPLSEEEYQQTLKDNNTEEAKNNANMDLYNYKSDDSDNYFYDSYKNIVNFMTKKSNRKKENASIEYSHPGIFREFNFDKKKEEKIVLIIQNPIEENQQNENEEGNSNTNVETNQNEIKGYNKDEDKNENYNIIKAWSCCMNTDEKSKGCNCKIIKNFNMF